MIFIGYASAFAPAPFSKRGATRIYIIGKVKTITSIIWLNSFFLTFENWWLTNFVPKPDPEMINHLANNCAEAASVMFINAPDGNDPHLVEAINTPQGWYFEDQGPSNTLPESRVVFMDIDDTE